MYFLTKLLTAIVLPPFNLAILWAVSLLLAHFQYKKLSRFCAVFGIVLLYVLSTPFVATKLSDLLVEEDRLTLQDYQTAQAIVVLSGGIRDTQELFSKTATNDATFDRLRYAAYLHKQTNLPILLTGRSPNGHSEALIMAKELEQFFGVESKWLEEKARNTKENALYSKQILTQSGIHKIVLVTNQWHMRRAKRTFEKQGFDVLPASTGAGITPENYYNIDYFLPQSGAFNSVVISLKEWLGYWKGS